MGAVIAIHAESGAFAAEWIAYCREKGIAFREVDCFATDITRQLQGCRALLWHWEHHDFEAQLFARQLITCAEVMGIHVFPSSATSWHYDDKVGQKYLLEACGAPLVPSYVFYDKKTALMWVAETGFPKVWKLRGGAGSQNVRLLYSAREARRIVLRAFGRGFGNSRLHAVKDRLWAFRRDRTVKAFLNIARGIARVFVPHEKNARSPVQQDYAYFQDFIAGNSFDIRVVVIGARAFAIKRLVREGDFRASGSGCLIYSHGEIPTECVNIAFRVAGRLGSQCCAFDFVSDGKSWLIVEISYAFTASAYKKCPGYWDSTLAWHDVPVTPERFMLDDLLASLQAELAHDA